MKSFLQVNISGFYYHPSSQGYRHLSGREVCLLLRLGLPEQADNGMVSLYIGLGLVAEDKPTEFSCTHCSEIGVHRF